MCVCSWKGNPTTTTRHKTTIKRCKTTTKTQNDKHSKWPQKNNPETQDDQKETNIDHKNTQDDYKDMQNNHRDTKLLQRDAGQLPTRKMKRPKMTNIQNNHKESHKDNKETRPQDAKERDPKWQTHKTQNHYKEMQTDYNETKKHHCGMQIHYIETQSGAFCCLAIYFSLILGVLLLYWEGWGAFHLSLPRARLSHNLSVACACVHVWEIL